MVTYGNLQKHNSSNPLQRWLIDRFHKCLRELTTNLELTSVLDAGCGEGFVARTFKSQHFTWRIMGIDLDKAALRRGLEWGCLFQVSQGDVVHLPLAGKSFDLVICTEVLEHLPQPEQALLEFQRIARRYCLFSVPHEPFFRGANFLRGKNLRRWGNDPEHLHNWSNGAFQSLVAQYFEILEVRWPFPWLVVLAKIQSCTS